MSMLRKFAVVVTVAASVSTLSTMQTSADAVPVGPRASAASSAAAHCDKAAVARNAERAPAWRLHRDAPKVTKHDLAAVQTQRYRQLVRMDLAAPLPDVVNVPVYVHVIRGKHRGERGPGRPRVRHIIDILNGGFSGAQSSVSVPTRFRFHLVKINYRRNDRWYHAYDLGKRDAQAKRHLHRGGRGTLNLYINGGGSRDYPILGWSRYPWQYASAPKLDSVSVNVAGMPGGRATNYNLGDTVIHETGHWLGLFHPFMGGCSEPNDQVSDTPEEAGPSFFCDTTSDSCPDNPGLDDVHNFMDYSYDSCLDEFTSGQVARMDAAWAQYRG